MQSAKSIECKLRTHYIVIWAVIAGMLLAASVLSGCEQDVEDEAPAIPSDFARPAAHALSPGQFVGKNIVIVSVDALRADHLGLYGYARETSPRLDQIAKQAITFERANAPRGLTWPSLVAMFTSLYPKSSNVRQNGDLLADDVPTLASLLKMRGYTTAAFLGNACGALTRGFDSNFCGSDESVHKRALAWIQHQNGSPFFLWVHYKAPHEEYLPPPEYDHFSQPDYRGPANGTREYLDRVILSQRDPEPPELSHVVDLYDGEVLYADTMMGEVWDALSKRGFLDQTIFVFTADHGEELLQHNHYFYHACSVYESVLHIPLILRLPKQNWRGMRISPLIENLDLAPSLLELVGIERPAGFEGQTLLPLINGESGSESKFTRAIAEYHRPGIGWIGTLRSDRWRYIYNPEKITTMCRPKGSYFEVSRDELYDHARDPLEKHNVAIEHDKLIVELRGQLLEAFDRQLKHAPPERANPRVIQQLKAMGYLVE